ncbi:MAG: HAD hydrolase-like protein, partial [Pseudomonadota bacterium]
RQPGDAATWADGLGITLTDIQSADAVLLMGLADDASEDAYRRELDIALQKGLTVYCSNPDLASPRGDGSVVISPGKLAHDHQARGGKVVFYGKPHKPIFQSVETALGTTRLLMIGDSLDHDIKGAAGSAWDSVFVMGGLYAQAFAGKDPVDVLTSLVQSKATPDPTFIIETVQ